MVSISLRAAVHAHVVTQSTDHLTAIARRGPPSSPAIWPSGIHTFAVLGNPDRSGTMPITVAGEPLMRMVRPENLRIVRVAKPPRFGAEQHHGSDCRADRRLPTGSRPIDGATPSNANVPAVK